MIMNESNTQTQTQNKQNKARNMIQIYFQPKEKMMKEIRVVRVYVCVGYIQYS